MNIVTNKNVFTKETGEETKGKVIRKSQIARQLLQRGAKMIDLKPDRNDPDRKRSVFVFEDDENFQKVFAEILAENKETRERRTINGDKILSELEELKKKFAELSKESV